MKMITPLLLILLLLIFSCASHRKKANCSEIRYRLDHLQYNADQREWIEEEWRQCELEYDSLSRRDSVKYESIYAQFRDSTKDSNSDSAADSTHDSLQSPSLSDTLGVQP